MGRAATTRVMGIGTAVALAGLSLASTPVAGAWGRWPSRSGYGLSVAVGPAGGGRVVAFEAPVGKASPGALALTAKLVAGRLGAMGVQHASAYRQGQGIVISLPRAPDDGQVLRFATEPGRLLFRPVACEVAPYRAASGRLVAKAPRLSALCHGPTAAQAGYPTTPAGQDGRSSTVLLAPSYPGPRLVLGPAEMTGSIVKAASAMFDRYGGGWQVALSFSPAGSALFDHYAAAHYRCYKQRPYNYNPPPCAQQAVDLDGVVLSAPFVEAATFGGSAVISGSTAHPFSREQATGIAAVIGHGPLPARLRAQGLQTITPSHPQGPGAGPRLSLTATTAPPHLGPAPPAAKWWATHLHH